MADLLAIDADLIPDPSVIEYLNSIRAKLQEPGRQYLGDIYIHMYMFIIDNPMNANHLDNIPLAIETHDAQIAYFIYQAYMLISNDPRCTPDVHQALLMLEGLCDEISLDTESGYGSPFIEQFGNLDDHNDAENIANTLRYCRQFVNDIRGSVNPIVQVIQFIADVSPYITNDDYISPAMLINLRDIIKSAFTQRLHAYYANNPARDNWIMCIHSIISDFASA